MKINKWIKENTSSLKGKTVAITGATGGLGRELCRYLAMLGASLVLMDRNAERSKAFATELLNEYTEIQVSRIPVDLSDIHSVKKAVNELIKYNVDVFIHNAGAYSIPRYITDIGYDNVFQINFISPYYIIRKLLPDMRKNKGRIVVVGSIAHNYSKADITDVDFHKRKKASRVYGNAKRYLMFSLYELFKDESDVSLSVTHPGITFTNITAHYPKLIFAVIKHPMKVIFMKPPKACLSVLMGVFEKCNECEWIGPEIFDVWGKPRKKLLRTCNAEERVFIGKTATKIYEEINNS